MIENQQTITVAGSGGAGGTDFDQITNYGATTVIIPASVGNATAVLADGDYVGQWKYIYCESRNATGSPKLDISLNSAGNQVRLDAAAEYAVLLWDGTDWQLIKAATGVHS